MTTPTAPQFQPVHIGAEAKPPLAVLPDPATLFSDRAARFRTLASDHQLAGYLTFLADISEAQSRILDDLPPATLPPDDDIERAIVYGMAPIARSAIAIDETVLTTLDRLFEAARCIAMPDLAEAARDGVIAAPEDERRVMIANVLGDALPANEIAEHVFVAAALQVHFARLAAQLPADRLTPVSDGACPACGGPPVASRVVNWEGSQSARFATCGACATQWHVVRVKCVACSSTLGIHYAHVEGTSEMLKAECCDTCGTYLKILQSTEDADLDAVADDVASAGLDLLVREQGLRRSGFNVYLAGL
ncbi:MAG: formate dehydrogenase accessory protein FdhE [Beijerinckiaceae bacterium]|jgi:FdhE protein|nr:formate dehydrogenase accessory protein FdhE [Beijerinckiaceae bacterium]